MASTQEERKELNEKARQGETVVPGGTGGKTLEAQQHLAEGFFLSYPCFFFFLAYFDKYGQMSPCLK